MYFQLKRTFKKQTAPYYQTDNEFKTDQVLQHDIANPKGSFLFIFKLVFHHYSILLSKHENSIKQCQETKNVTKSPQKKQKSEQR